jgi:poly(3-hydroxybutyrate) depolymerase
MNPKAGALMVLAALANSAAAAVAAAATASLAIRAGGCGKTHLLRGITQYHDLLSSGKEREYSVHLPGDYDKDKQYPVVLGFHGTDSVGFFFEVDTKMSQSRFSANVRGRYHPF